jgi:hypothetical protein
MRLRLLISLLVVTAATAAATAAAQTGRSGKARGKSRTEVTVRRCETGDTPGERLALFRGQMRAIRHTRRMMMRFVLIERSPEGESPAAAPKRLSRWHRSRRHVRTFRYKQTVTGLQPGVTYLTLVRYRWLRKGKRKSLTVRRRSAECRQDGDLPNLAVGPISARRGLAPGNEIYSMPVTNTGKAVADSVKVDLMVDSASADAYTIESLAPGQTETIEISGPACRGHVRAVVDPENRIVETTEGDNSRRRRCPPVAP